MSNKTQSLTLRLQPATKTAAQKAAAAEGRKVGPWVELLIIRALELAPDKRKGKK